MEITKFLNEFKKECKLLEKEVKMNTEIRISDDKIEAALFEYFLDNKDVILSDIDFEIEIELINHVFNDDEVYISDDNFDKFIYKLDKKYGETSSLLL